MLIPNPRVRAVSVPESLSQTAQRRHGLRTRPRPKANPARPGASPSSRVSGKRIADRVIRAWKTRWSIFAGWSLPTLHHPRVDARKWICITKNALEPRSV